MFQPTAVGSQAIPAVGGQHRTVQIRRRPEQHQTAAVPGQLDQQLTRVLAQDHLLLEDCQAGRAIAIGNGPIQAIHGFLPDQAEQIAHLFFADSVIAQNAALIQDADSIPNTAVRLQGNEPDRLRRGVDSGLAGDVGQVVRQFAHADPSEVIPLTTGQDSRGDPVRLGGRQHENHMGRRFLQRFQQSVERLVGQHVDFIDDINLIAGLRRRKLHIFPQIANLVDAPVRCGIDLINIHRHAVINQFTGTAVIAGRRRRPLLAVQSFRQDFGGAGLTGSPRSGKQIGVGNTPRHDRIFQRHADMLLADQALEVPRPPLPVQRFIGHVIRPLSAPDNVLHPGGDSLRRAKKKTASAAGL